MRKRTRSDTHTTPCKCSSANEICNPSEKKTLSAAVRPNSPHKKTGPVQLFDPEPSPLYVIRPVLEVTTILPKSYKIRKWLRIGRIPPARKSPDREVHARIAPHAISTVTPPKNSGFLRILNRVRARLSMRVSNAMRWSTRPATSCAAL